MDDHAKLTRAMATLLAHRERNATNRQTLRTHAQEQLDTLPHAIDTASDYLAKGKGGLLTHRYLRARLVERERLHTAAFAGGMDEPDRRPEE